MAAVWSFFSEAFTGHSSNIYSTSYSSVFIFKKYATWIWDAKQFFQNTR
jgi:hypothetical protein